MSLQVGQSEPEKTGTEFKDKLAVIGRMVLTGSGVAFTLAGAFGLFTSMQIEEATPVFKKLIEDSQSVAQDLWALWGILGLSLMAFAAKFGLGAASLSGKLKSITSNKKVEVQGTIIVPAEIAEKVPSPKVIAPPTS